VPPFSSEAHTTQPAGVPLGVLLTIETELGKVAAPQAPVQEAVAATNGAVIFTQ